MKAWTWTSVATFFLLLKCPIASATECAQAFSSDPVRPLNSIQELRVANFNIMNFITPEARAARARSQGNVGMARGFENQPLSEAQIARHQELAKVIRENKMDIAVLEEIGGEISTKYLCNTLLKGEYRPFFIEGNDSRGFDIAMIVKRDLPFNYQYKSNRDEMAESGEKTFSRDLPMLTVLKAGSNQPLMIILGNHSKSMRPSATDPDGSIKRTQQANRTAEIVQDLQLKYGAKLPIIVAGDFNNSLNYQPEYTALWRSGHLEDAFNVVKNKSDFEDRITHSFHGEDGVSYRQLDALLVSQGAQPWVKTAEVYRYQDGNGKAKPLPTRIQERKENPSDHFPVIVTLDLQGLIAGQLQPAQ